MFYSGLKRKALNPHKMMPGVTYTKQSKKR